MKVSLKWLKTLVALPELKNAADLRKFTDRLDLTGTAVDGVIDVGGGFSGVVVGQIAEREPHPNSDHMWLCRVDVGSVNLGADGQPEPLQIVCGAQNFAAGDKTAVAMIGAELPGGVKIKKSKLRGIASCGMNCSERELGLSDEASGIMILPPDAPLGQPLADYLGQHDTVLDLEITPNRPDCMSVLGVAREVAAVYDEPYRLPELAELLESDEQPACYPELDSGSPAENTAGNAADLIDVTIDDVALCSRYTARLIKNVKVGPSPAWLAERVEACGTRSINNIVDVTNYIMYELGQPLHAFDYDTLTKGADGKVHIVVRASGEGEKFTTLDGIERELNPDIAAIVDGNAAAGAGQTVCLAGVMGGLNSEVTEHTTNILLEAAAFDPGHSSRTSRSLKLFSEASQRYERGVDAATCADFSLRAAQLMAAVGGGSLCAGLVDVYPTPQPTYDLDLDLAWFDAFIGAEIPAADVQSILERLGCVVKDAGERHLQVQTPTFRPDLPRAVDLAEEVLRIWGMSRVEATLPGGRGRVGQISRESRIEQRIGELLRASGLSETMTYAFVEPGDMAKLRMPLAEQSKQVELLNPIVADESVLRQSLIPNLLKSVTYNQNHGTDQVLLYELDRVFVAKAGRKLPKERKLVAGVICGDGLDFFDAKGVVEGILAHLGIVQVAFSPTELAWLQPGQAAEVKGQGGPVFGWVGQIHPLAAQAFGCSGSVFAFELELNALIKAAHEVKEVRSLSDYPEVALDLAVVVPDEVSFADLHQAIFKFGGSLLKSAELFDVFSDPAKLGADKKSLAFNLSFGADDHTLTQDAAEEQLARIVKKLNKQFGAELRH
ncbi:MAG: phenylalanine--tRNA ligase subunit beta [Coriobacteriales bacterium]|jgi:phenylalanyl-tRNA synthetase beta chain|nr:phenylalanine--tRNA ligase subunit beta [Coriobacteriales bacterium]